MARHFAQKNIDEFRECFALYAPRNIVSNPDQLLFILRSLGYSPTRDETVKYFKSRKGKIDFASFLEIIYEHSQNENCYKDILNAFLAHDRQRKGVIPAKELKAILTGICEKLTPREVDLMLQEVGVSSSGMVRYEELAKLMTTPMPDYAY